MKIKMIVVDLDGTLLRDDKTASPRTMAALSRLREQGIKIVYASARSVGSIALPPSTLFDGRVNNNGAQGFVGNELIYVKPMPPESYRELVHALDNADVKACVTADDAVYLNFHPDFEYYTEYILTKLGAVEVYSPKIWAIIDGPHVVDIFKANLAEDMSLFVAHDGYAFAMHKDAAKSKAVAALAAHWNILPAEIMAFGDDVNDIDMLTYAGAGVAMGNALDAVKAAANHICGTNEDDGIARFLEEYFGGQYLLN